MSTIGSRHCLEWLDGLWSLLRNGLIYLIGLIVVIMAVLSLLGLRWQVEAGRFVVATSTRSAPIASDTALNIQWSAIIAGAIGASALAFVLHTFAGAIDLSVSSAAPTWRDASMGASPK
jgi:hypothetical protein